LEAARVNRCFGKQPSKELRLLADVCSDIENRVNRKIAHAQQARFVLAIVDNGLQAKLETTELEESIHARYFAV
jgi:hypothetical protein